MTESGLPFLTSTYSYDVRDFLIDETHVTPDVTKSRSYLIDSAGLRVNQTQVDGGTSKSIDYSYDAGHQLSEVDGTAIRFDKFGRQSNDHQGQSFSYGLANQLLEVKKLRRTVETFSHDVDGQRVSRTVHGGTHTYVPGLVSGQVLVHIRPDGKVEETVYTPSGTAIALIGPGNVVEPMLKNITGSTYRIARGADLYYQADYFAFGEPLQESGTLQREIGFHQMWDNQTDGVLTAGVRSYDPDTGMFLSPDPLSYQAASDINDAANLYVYAQHNPVTRIDSSGYQSRPVRPDPGPGWRSQFDLPPATTESPRGGAPFPVGPITYTHGAISGRQPGGSRAPYFHRDNYRERLDRGSSGTAAARAR